MSIFAWLLSSADFFQNQFFSKNSNTIKVSNSLDPDQARHFVGPDLGPNCLQRLSEDDTCRQRVNHFDTKIYIAVGGLRGYRQLGIITPDHS